jgi:hypothetical protein
MLFQNFKGFLTLALVLSMVATGFYFYKGIVEPGFINQSSVDQFALTTEEVEVSPKIEVYESKATITWQTPYESSGGVTYCTNKTNPGSCKNSAVSFGKDHTIELAGLNPETNYYYKIEIDGLTYPTLETEYYSFNTKQGAAKTPLNARQTVQETENEGDFAKAMRDQDLSFDYNKDGKVTLADMKYKN